MRRTALFLAAALAGPTAAADRPNIVVVLVDDLRHDGLGCTGHPFAKTPNIDRLAAEGVKFTNAFVSLPLCSPSRSSFLTGKYAHSTGVTDNTDRSALSHRLVTFPKLLHDAGYATAYVGKWHMGTDDTPRPGFDRWVSFRGQGVFTDPPLNIDGERVKATGYMTDILNEHAVEFVKKQSKEKPFCLYLAHKAVHGPFTPADRHKDLYVGAKFPPPASANDDRSDKPAVRENALKPAPKKPAPKEDFGVMRNQMRCMASIDEGIGALRQALADGGHESNTLFVFTSDNGYFWGEHGGLGDKRWAYDESIRIPLIARFPKLAKPGVVAPQLVMNVDLAPTVLNLAGVKVPTDVHGRSLVPLLKGDSSGWRTSILTEYFQEKAFPRTPTWRAVRTDAWKYIRYPDRPEWDELYDLAADPHERKNRIGDPAAKDRLAGLKAELDRLLAATGG